MPKNSLKKNKLVSSDKTSANILIPRLVFIIATLGLVLFGLVMVYSASSVEAVYNNENPLHYLVRQVGFGALGIIGALIIWRVVPIGVWRSNVTWIAFGACFLLMVVTGIAGPTTLGARRWLYIAGFSLQSSEFGKIALVLLVAKLHYHYQTGKITFLRFIGAGGISAALMMFVVLVPQSDMGTTAIMFLGIIVALWVGRFSRVLIGLFILLAVVAGLFVLVFGSSYRSSRFAFLDPYNDGANGYGAGYQIIRSQYAFSEGGITGLGLGGSYEKFQYLPEAETDYIFAIIGEELGMIGCIFVLAMYVTFLISGLFVARNSGSLFGAEISSSFVIMIFAQALLNMVCALGMFPTTGKPLPFISYGGSSLIATLLMVGFVLSASEESALPDKYEKKRSTFRVFQFIKGLGSYAGDSINYNNKVREEKKLQTQREEVATARQKLQNSSSYETRKTLNPTSVSGANATERNWRKVSQASSYSGKTSTKKSSFNPAPKIPDWFNSAKSSATIQGAAKKKAAANKTRPTVAKSFNQRPEPKWNQPKKRTLIPRKNNVTSINSKRR